MRTNTDLSNMFTFLNLQKNAAWGKEIVQHLAECGVEGFTTEKKFGLGIVKKHLINFAKTHRELTKECKKLTRENMKEQWPSWKAVLRCD